MELINCTRMTAGYTLGMEPGGRELLVVVVKGTFGLPAEQGGRLALHEAQVPLLSSDVFFGEPGVSAPKYEVDFAPRKRRCDVLLHGHGYAPGGRPTDRVAVEVRIGDWSKSFSVIGDRVWYSSGGARATAPTPFTKMPISYEYAFGGVDSRHPDPARHVAFWPNPVGRGFHQHLAGKWLEGSPLPNTEEFDATIHKPDGAYRPMSFGGLGRHWRPRSGYAGTYDQHWLDEVFPFLPADFDEAYYQAAPADQQLLLPVGEQPVLLQNLTAAGRSHFVLPHFEAPIYVLPKNGPREEYKAPVDTIMIEPDLERVTLMWRVARPLRKSLFEIRQILVGRKGKEWWQQREEIVVPFPTRIATRPRSPVTEEPA